MRQDYSNYQNSSSTPKRPIKRTIFFIVLTVLILFIGFRVVRGIFAPEVSNNPDDYNEVTLEPKAPENIIKRLGSFVFKNNATLAGERDDRINMLLMGMGGVGHDGPFLTDTMIIASIKPSTGEVAMVSLPRDLGVRIPGHGWYKINHASAFGEADRSNWGGAFATEVVEDTFDIDIHYYVRVDFKAFEEIIDEMNGITINVERSFTDTEFPAPSYEYQVVSFSEGEQQMDGETSLHFARSRHGNNGEGSDFARAKRQQKTILAMQEKALSFETLANPVRINNIIETLDRHITTNMEFADIISLLRIGRAANTENITLLVLDSAEEGFLDAGTSPTGAFILSPKTGNFDQINETIENIFTYEPGKQVNDTPDQQTKPVLSPATIEIQNGTWMPGLAARTKTGLSELDLDIPTLGNTETRPQTDSALVQLSTNDLTDVLTTLSTKLGIPIKQSLPDGVTPDVTSDIIIILGEDFES